MQNDPLRKYNQLPLHVKKNERISRFWVEVTLSSVCVRTLETNKIRWDPEQSLTEHLFVQEKKENIQTRPCKLSASLMSAIKK